MNSKTILFQQKFVLATRSQTCILQVIFSDYNANKTQDTSITQTVLLTGARDNSKQPKWLQPKIHATTKGKIKLISLLQLQDHQYHLCKRFSQILQDQFRSCSNPENYNISIFVALDRCKTKRNQKHKRHSNIVYTDNIK